MCIRSFFFILFIIGFAHLVHSQFIVFYTSYLPGNSQDTIVQCDFGIYMMGEEHKSNPVMSRLLEAANGSDAVVFKTTTSSGFNVYMPSLMRAKLNSAKTIALIPYQKNHLFTFSKNQIIA